ncbi:hypothetical protein HS088_TW14G00202 [Tripterygium wilfordii]|uniref:Uncharacterized protein n=1 Tax=Tripterygium wilfordii TaxID=458696 RepID=A0A7J7CPZ0_TRIWF|nr:UPF0496 protein At2g18630-like [Tripterygium wilfordii]XP_038722908.1 UPF0496 protein At2g18630-like [Tripterygium wilfordii]KAF5736068.1 hypothetical protein HS088_TW14G00202 [Tripterygium wilfordii]
MMGGQCSTPSKTKGGDTSQSSSQINKDGYKVDLDSYEEAVKNDPKLQSFDTHLHERTNRVIIYLASGVEMRSLSFESLKEVINALLEMNQEVVKIVVENRTDIWNSEDLFALVEEYFDNSVKILEFCNALEHSLKCARNSQLLIQIAVRQFDEEVERQDGVEGMKYTRTLQGLQRFKAAEDPFTDEFFALFQAVYKQQVSMLEKLQVRKRKLDKKMRKVKGWRRLSNALFVAAFVSVLIFSVVAAAIAAPPVVTTLAGALAIPIGSVGKWCNMLWTWYQNTLKGEREVLISMEIGTCLSRNYMESIRALINKLEIKINSMLQNTEFALVEEDAVKFVMDEIKKDLEVFMETIEDLGNHADRCSRHIRQARTVILQKMINQNNSSSIPSILDAVG